MKNYSIAIIGCGIIADIHIISILSKMPNATISLCDLQKGKAELLRKRYSLHASYNSIEEILAVENPDVAHILSPPNLHFSHTMSCLNAGCHVLLEKPGSFLFKEINEMFTLAKKMKRTLCVDHSMLCQPSVLKLQNKVKKNNEETLYFTNFYGIDRGTLSSSTLPEGHWKRQIPGGAIIDAIIHPIALAVELSGKPLNVSVKFRKKGGQIVELSVSWNGEKAINSITVSTQAIPFRRISEITTNKSTYYIDHGIDAIISIGSGTGPKSFRKLQKNFSQGFQLVFKTIHTIFKVLSGQLKNNPGAREVIIRFYNYLDGKGDIPVTEENIKNASLALEMILNEIKKSDSDVTKITNNQIPFDLTKPESLTTPSILVTGASGFLGREICKTLSANRICIQAQVRRGFNADKLISPYIFKVYEDFNNDNVDYINLVKGMKCIIHCAHASGAKKWSQYKKINVDATIALYKAAREAGCEKFIFISSVAVYGVHQKRKLIVSEESNIKKGHSKWDFYIRSKILAENELTLAESAGGPEVIIIRPGVLYSKDGMRLARRGIQLKNSKMLIIFGNGRNFIPYTRVDILAETICRLAINDVSKSRIYNLTGAYDGSFQDFIYDRMKHNGMECTFLNLPALPFRILAYISQILRVITFRKVPPKISTYIIDSCTRNIRYDCSKAEKDLGWDCKKAVCNDLR